MKLKIAVASAVAGVILGAGALSFATPEETQAAKEIMLTACDAYAGSQTMKVKALISMDDFYDRKTKIQRNFVVDVTAKNPNKYKAVVQGDEAGTVVFNGSQVVVLDQKTNFYAQKDLSGNLADLVLLTDRLNIPTPILDFMEPVTCKESIQKADEGEIIGEFDLNGEVVKHLLFKNNTDKINWEAWVKVGADRSVVRKMLITSAHLKEQPQYEFLILSETRDEAVADEEFEFALPARAEKVDFLEDLN